MAGKSSFQAGNGGGLVALLVGPESPGLVTFLNHVIDAAGIKVRCVRTYTEAVIALGHRAPDIIVLYVQQAEAGQAFLDQARSITDRPAIVVGPQLPDVEVARILLAGAEDFIPMPLGPLELQARIQVVLRRREGLPGEGLLAVGELRIDVNKATASRNGSCVRLSPEEFRLLIALARHPGKVLDHEMLIEKVWGGPSLATSESLRTLVRRLRARLRPLAKMYEPPIVSVHGFGYYLADEAKVSSQRTNERTAGGFTE